MSRATAFSLLVVAAAALSQTSRHEVPAESFDFEEQQERGLFSFSGPPDGSHERRAPSALGQLLELRSGITKGDSPVKDKDETTYTKIGKGLCGCTSDDRGYNFTLDGTTRRLGLCNSDALLDASAADFVSIRVRKRRKEVRTKSVIASRRKACRWKCSAARDCMAYQFVPTSMHDRCLLYLWHRVPSGVLGPQELGRYLNATFNVVGSARVWKKWEVIASSPCMVKDQPFRGFESERFAVMPSDEFVRRGRHKFQYWVPRGNRAGGFSRRYTKFGTQRFCTCGARSATDRGRRVCAVADEQEGLDQEAAEKICLERNRRSGGSDGEAKNSNQNHVRGCAGFMSFSSISMHYKNKKESPHVLFFSGGQRITGIAEDMDTYKAKGGQEMYSPYVLNADRLDGVGDKEMSASGAPRCVYLMDYNGTEHTFVEPAVGTSAAAGAGAVEGGAGLEGGKGGGGADAGKDWSSRSSASLTLYFNLAVAGVAVFAVGLVVVAVCLAAVCRKHARYQARRSGAGWNNNKVRGTRWTPREEGGKNKSKSKSKSLPPLRERRPATGVSPAVKSLADRASTPRAAARRLPDRRGQDAPLARTRRHVLTLPPPEPDGSDGLATAGSEPDDALAVTLGMGMGGPAALGMGGRSSSTDKKEETSEEALVLQLTDHRREAVLVLDERIHPPHPDRSRVNRSLLSTRTLDTLHTGNGQSVTRVTDY